MFLDIVLPVKSTQKEKRQKQEREEGRINKCSFLDDIMMLFYKCCLSLVRGVTMTFFLSIACYWWWCIFFLISTSYFLLAFHIQNSASLCLQLNLICIKLGLSVKWGSIWHYLLFHWQVILEGERIVQFWSVDSSTGVCSPSEFY